MIHFFEVEPIEIFIQIVWGIQKEQICKLFGQKRQSFKQFGVDERVPDLRRRA